MQNDKIKTKVVDSFLKEWGNEVYDYLQTYLDDEVDVYRFIIQFQCSNKAIHETEQTLWKLFKFHEGLPDIERSLYDALVAKMYAINPPKSEIAYPFKSLKDANNTDILNALQSEHPQVIAMVLSWLEPNKSSAILSNLPVDIMGEVSHRIATMDYISPEDVREVERVLEKKLLNEASTYHTVGGIESVVEILNLCNREIEKNLIEYFEDEDPELAEEIKKRMFIFEDIIMMHDRDIQKVMREIDSQELARALIGIDEEIINKILGNFTARGARLLREDMQYMGSVKLSDVEKAQENIVSIIRKMEESGEIAILRSGDDYYVEADLRNVPLREEQDEEEKQCSCTSSHNCGCRKSFWVKLIKGFLGGRKQ